MTDCPDAITWQAVVDGEEHNPALWDHLEKCPACRAVFQDIKTAAGLADILYAEETLPPAVARQIFRRVHPFPAGLVAALLFCLLVGSIALLQPGGFSWWLSVGLSRQCSLLLDGLFGVLMLLQRADPFMVLLAALLLVGLEIVVLYKLKLTEG